VVSNTKILSRVAQTACCVLLSLVVAGCEKNSEISNAATTSQGTAAGQSQSPTFAASSAQSNAAGSTTDGFEGAWDDFKIKPIVDRIMDRVSWAGLDVGCQTTCDVSHQTLKVFELTHNGVDQKLALVSSNDTTNDCQTCAPRLSLFVFRKTERGWVLSDQHLAFAPWGANGRFPTDEVLLAKLVPLARNDSFALTLTSHQTVKSVRQTIVAVFVPHQGQLVQSFKDVLGEDSRNLQGSNQTEWESDWQITSNDKQVQLVIKSQGLKAGKTYRQEKRLSLDGPIFKQQS
jgi:hypothetical protein